MTSPTRIRTVRLTGKGRAALAANERLAPADVFPPYVYDAIRAAGYDVWFARVDALTALAIAFGEVA